MYENRQYAQETNPIPNFSEKMNPTIPENPFIGRDGKSYYSEEELHRADAMYENRQYAQETNPIPDVDFDETHHKTR